MSVSTVIEAQALLDELVAMCDHPRFRRYRIRVRQRGHRLVLYETFPGNVKATLHLPAGRRQGQLFVNDSIVNTMIRVAGGEQVRAFAQGYGAHPDALARA